MTKYFYLTQGPLQVLPLRIKVDQVLMVMKEYSTFLKSPELETHHQMVYYHL